MKDICENNWPHFGKIRQSIKTAAHNDHRNTNLACKFLRFFSTPRTRYEFQPREDNSGHPETFVCASLQPQEDSGMLWVPGILSWGSKCRQGDSRSWCGVFAIDFGVKLYRKWSLPSQAVPDQHPAHGQSRMSLWVFEAGKQNHQLGYREINFFFLPLNK